MGLFFTFLYRRSTELFNSNMLSGVRKLSNKSSMPLKPSSTQCEVSKKTISNLFFIDFTTPQINFLYYELLLFYVLSR